MRLALGVSYNGQGYEGWQSQRSGNTLQDHLEAALRRFTAQPQAPSTVCAGRTDAGVHGLLQVVHFDTDLRRDEFSWVRGTNTFLPRDIAVQWARAVPESFHARNSARGRRYAYVLLQSTVRPSVEAGRVGWVYRPLDAEAMRAATRHLIGEHDFTSFRASSCQSPTPVKTLRRIDIQRRGAYWRVEFEANAFLHHMIRNIMGCLLQVGQGLQPPEWMRQVLDARDRDAASPTFPPEGLYFLGPMYEPHWNLPAAPVSYDWLPA